MRRSIRKLFAAVMFLALVWFLLATVVGPVLLDGVAFYAPIMLFALLAWRLRVYGKRRSHSYTFLTGAAGGFIGTLVWPTGILVGMMLSGNADHLGTPIVDFFACCFVSTAIGGVVAMLLSFAFDSLPKRSEDRSDEEWVEYQQWVKHALAPELPRDA